MHPDGAGPGPRRRRARVAFDLAGPAAAPRVVLLHGACFGPDTMAEAARRLSRRCRVILVHRRGYGRSHDVAPAATVAEHVADVIEVLDAVGTRRAVLVGVSGGATIAVAAAVAHPHRVAGLVAHEPALGPLAPGVNGILSAGLGALAQATDPADGAEAIGRLLAGHEAYTALGPSVRAAVRALAPVVACEVPGFAGFAPSADDLRGLAGMPVVSSLGARSRPQRMEAARVLAAHARTGITVVPRCGHLVQIDAPGALVHAVARVTTPAPKEER